VHPLQLEHLRQPALLRHLRQRSPLWAAQRCSGYRLRQQSACSRSFLWRE